MSRHRRHRTWGCSVDKGQFLIETHLRTGRPIGELAGAHGVHRSWLYKLLARYRARGRRRARAAIAAAAAQPDADRGPPRRRHRRPAQEAHRRRLRRRRRDHPLPPVTRARRRAIDLHDLAGAQSPRVRHPPTPQASPQLMATLRSRAPQPVLAGRRHPRRRRRRDGHGGPQHHRRPLTSLCRVPRVHHRPQP